MRRRINFSFTPYASLNSALCIGLLLFYTICPCMINAHERKQASSPRQAEKKAAASDAAFSASDKTSRRLRVFAQVTIYDILPGRGEDFEVALLSMQGAIRAEPAFINERVLRNIDPLTLQYATYSKFSDRGAADRSTRERMAKIRVFCRRDPEVHLLEVTHSYFPEGITDHPTGKEFGSDITGQIAHLGLFIPFPKYYQQYEDVLHETKVLTRAKSPEGYIGEDIMDEVEVTPPQQQTPYSPHPDEPTKMSINYGEYRTMENAEDSYITRQQVRDPKLVTMERIFFSSLQVPTRFYIFQVVGNYSRVSAKKRASEVTTKIGK